MQLYGRKNHCLPKMERWSKGYAFVEFFVRYAYWLSYKRIVVHGAENIPKNKPIIFAPNHQNALMDPLSVLTTSKTQPVWLARADIFKVKITRPILKFLKIIPVYRLRDGKENLQNNEVTFDLAIRVLENNNVIALFPEAAHSGKRQMLAHKKAVPRIAFLAEEKNNFELDLQVVPVGLYYSHYWNFNRSIIVNYGKPIVVDKYKKLFNESEHAATMALKSEIREAIEPLVLDIKSKEYYAEYEQIREFAGLLYSKRRKFHGNKCLNQLYSDKELIEKLELLEKENHDKFLELSSETKTYFNQLTGEVFSNKQVKPTQFKEIFSLIINLILVVVMLPVFIAGFTLNGIQFIVPRIIINKKIKDPIFRGTFNFVLGMVLFPFFHFVFAIILGVIFHSFLIGAISFLFMLPLGKLTYQIFEFYQCLYKKSRFIIFRLSKPDQYKKIVVQKTFLIQKLKDLNIFAAD